MDWNLTTIFEAMLLMCCFIVVRMLKPWLKANTTLKQREAINRMMDTFVVAAEQVFGSGNGQMKLAQVLDWAESQDVDAEVQDVEAAVWRLRNQQPAGEQGNSEGALAKLYKSVGLSLHPTDEAPPDVGQCAEDAEVLPVQDETAAAE
ncbi:hypothetical protein AGMMS49992_26640 [Clostridia bacterium]|nr:hypothetical protein AGMMS49992_26640 [Clostridia bacterium]